LGADFSDYTYAMSMVPIQQPLMCTCFFFWPLCLAKEFLRARPQINRGSKDAEDYKVGKASSVTISEGQSRCLPKQQTHR